MLLSVITIQQHVTCHVSHVQACARVGTPGLPCTASSPPSSSSTGDWGQADITLSARGTPSEHYLHNIYTLYLPTHYIFTLYLYVQRGRGGGGAVRRWLHRPGQHHAGVHGAGRLVSTDTSLCGYLGRYIYISTYIYIIYIFISTSLCVDIRE